MSDSCGENKTNVDRWCVSKKGMQVSMIEKNDEEKGDKHKQSNKQSNQKQKNGTIKKNGE